MNTDPYSAPRSDPHDPSILAEAGMVSAAAVAQLAATKPWVRFISVIMFVGVGFMLMAAAGMAMVAVVGGMGHLGNQANNPLSGPMGFGVIAFYVALSIVYVYPGVKLWKYASSIAMLIRTGRNADLVAALNQQRSLWKFVGILMIVVIVLYVIGTIVFVAFVGMTAVKGH